MKLYGGTVKHCIFYFIQNAFFPLMLLGLYCIGGMDVKMDVLF